MKRNSKFGCGFMRFDDTGPEEDNSITTSKMAINALENLLPSDRDMVFQFADVAMVLSSLKKALPLERFRVLLDGEVLRNLSQRIIREDFCAYLKAHLAGESQMLGIVDVKTLVHYLVLTSTEEQFGLDFQDLDVLSLCGIFSGEFGLSLGYFSALDLDQNILNCIASFYFVQKYRQAYRFMFEGDSFQRVCQREQVRLYHKMIPTQSKLYQFLDQVSQQLSHLFDEVVGATGSEVILSLSEILGLFNILELLTLAMSEARTLTGEPMRFELAQTGGMVMHFSSQLVYLLQYSGSVPCLAQVHTTMCERLVNCLNYLYLLNKKALLPIDLCTCTPLSSPMGRSVVYSCGIVQCLLENIQVLIKTGCTVDLIGPELLLMSDLLCRVIAAAQSDNDFHLMFRREISKQNILSLLSSLCMTAKQLLQANSDTAQLVCNLVLDIFIAIYQTKVYITNQNFAALAATFTLELRGNVQLRQKCCFLLQRLKTKKDLSTYFKPSQFESYVPGADAALDLLFEHHFK